MSNPETLPERIIAILADEPRPYVREAELSELVEDRELNEIGKALDSLVEQGKLEADKRYDERIWYINNSEIETVIPFVSRSFFAILNANGKTIERAERFATVFLSHYDDYIFKFNSDTARLPGTKSDHEVRELVSKVCEYKPLVDAIVDYHWKTWDAAIYTDREAQAAVIQSEDSQRLERVLDTVPDEALGNYLTEREITIKEDYVISTIDDLSSRHHIRDKRDIQMKRDAILQPIYNGEIEELSPYAEIQGIDVEYRAHVFDPADLAIYITDDTGEVDERVEIGDEEQLAEWEQHVRDKCGWIEYQQ